MFTRFPIFPTRVEEIISTELFSKFLIRSLRDAPAFGVRKKSIAQLRKWVVVVHGQKEMKIETRSTTSAGAVEFTLAK